MNGTTFLIMSERKLKFVTIENISIPIMDQIIKRLNEVIKLYGKIGDGSKVGGPTPNLRCRSKSTSHEGRGRASRQWWHQTAAERQMKTTLKEISEAMWERW